MRIILADHHAQPRWALKLLLDEQPEFDIISEAREAQGLLLLAGERRADLVLVDQDLPGLGINDLIARLHELAPGLIIIIMSSKPECSTPLLEAGADAFISKVDQPDWLLEKLYKYAKQVDRKEDADRNESP